MSTLSEFCLNKQILALDLSYRNSQGRALSWKWNISLCYETSTMNSQVIGIGYEITIMGN